jgi:hypothetical protein
MMDKQDRYLAAHPGLLWVSLTNDTGQPYSEPIVAWMMPGTDRGEEIDDAAAFGLWPVTLSGPFKPGSQLGAVLFDNGKVYEPGHHWHDSITAWRNDAKVKKRIRARQE